MRAIRSHRLLLLLLFNFFVLFITIANAKKMSSVNNNHNDAVDAIIIGSGLAGLTTALTIVDAGGTVIILEKETKLGGNSIKASSGINAVPPITTTSSSNNNNHNDNFDNQQQKEFLLNSFRQDTILSAGKACNPLLIEQLVIHSHDYILEWLQQRLNIDLSQVTQLGGHSQPRTHRPNNSKLPIGAEIMIKLISLIKSMTENDHNTEGEIKEVKQEQHKNHNKTTPKVTIYTNARATQLLREGENENDQRIVGVKFEVNNTPNNNSNNNNNNNNNAGDSTVTTTTKEIKELRAKNVVLATGGFAADRSNNSWLAKVRPELLSLGATAGEFSTGDGLSLVTGTSSTISSSGGAGGGGGGGGGIKAKLIDMEYIQVHPTGFIDPKDPNNPNKFLAAEILRGVGGILLNDKGQRFCNEIGRRDYVTDQIFSLNEKYATTKQWNAQEKVPQVFLLLSEEGASKITKHVEFYVWKGFLSKLTGIQAVSEYIGVSKDTIKETLVKYETAAKVGIPDEFGKDRFVAIPKIVEEDENDDTIVLYVGKVEPVLHYCMGGIKINEQGQVLSENDDKIIPGLYACGEVTGGVHGENRLAGNSLCECVVYGRIVGQAIAKCSNSNVSTKT